MEQSDDTGRKAPILVDIWTDVVCPWCYIGKRRFEAGLAIFADSGDSRPVEVTYHSFELSPDTPVDFRGSVVDYLVANKGITAQEARAMLAQTTELAKAEGLRYDYASAQHTNTAKAHELLHLAKTRGKQAAMEERLMAAYFTEGRHIGRDQELADLAAELGLDREEALRALEAGTWLGAVRDDEATAGSYGINGVPFFVIDNKYGISGAQAPETFAKALAQAASEQKAAEA
jgi:predicted DsbA family dithiol-disulfide isomerase